jgi:hypothetical protein
MLWPNAPTESRCLIHLNDPARSIAFDVHDFRVMIRPRIRESFRIVTLTCSRMDSTAHDLIIERGYPFFRCS